MNLHKFKEHLVQIILIIGGDTLIALVLALSFSLQYGLFTWFIGTLG